jgi:NADH-quinone oxidoreductase subunit J
MTHTKAMGLEMYTTYLLPFEIAGLILLVALIGGLVLARRDEGKIEEAETPSDQQPRPHADPKEVTL